MAISSEERKSNGESGTDSGLPHYDNPPVVETFLSVAFNELDKWNIPHFGLYWREIRSDYPKFEILPPLPTAIERYGAVSPSDEGVLELLSQPPVRCWFIHQSSTRLIQVQNDRFVFNWRKIKPEDIYPRFDEAIRGQFAAEWSRFIAFLKSESVTPPTVTQCEIAYINHVPLEDGWKTYQSLVEGFSTGSLSGGEFLPSPENINLHATYLLPEKKGRLHIHLQPATRNIDGKRIVQLTLTVRGCPLPTASDAELLEWFDLGREWIVRGFTDFTSATMHEVWQRRR
jgi:uncharacterized protein (TIGR04255 family)